MSKITQEAYDEEIRELMEGLGMTEEEAVEDAMKCFEMKVMPHPLFISLDDQWKISWSLRAIMWVMPQVVENFHFHVRWK